MLIFKKELENKYINNDVILSYMQKISNPEDKKFTSHRWLLESLPKRMIYKYMYGDLLAGQSSQKKILDVGGGYSALTRILLKKNNYYMLDIMAHDDHQKVKALQSSIGKEFWINSDWLEYSPENPYDIVIANDLFPNVDQRLELFINKYLPICDEMRISLTYYNDSRWYRVKRTDADEVFHMMAYNGEQLNAILTKYINYIQNPVLDDLKKDIPSLFSNKRQVCMVVLKGEGII